MKTCFDFKDRSAINLFFGDRIKPTIDAANLIQHKITSQMDLQLPYHNKLTKVNNWPDVTSLNGHAKCTGLR